MKRFFIILMGLFVSSNLQANEITNTFSEKYKALLPPPNSSAHQDYLFEQISLGSEYTIILLDMIQEKNDITNEKMDRLIEKFDVLIDQNNEIIKLLEEQKTKKQ